MTPASVAASAAPSTPVGARFIGTYTLAFLGLWMAFFAPIQVLLAQQMELIAPLAKESALGWATGAGALVALIANPVAGALSDRTRTRWGRRHPWTFGGAFTGALALVLLGQQHTLVGVAACWCLAQLALNAVLAALMAELPDQVPVAQRARTSAFTGITQPLGVVLGTLAVTLVATGIAAGYALVAVLLVLLVAPFTVLVRDAPASAAARERLSWRAFAAGMRREARAHPDLARAWCMRFLVQTGSALGTLYLLYFLRDVIRWQVVFPGERAENGLVVMVLIYTGGVIAGAFVSGRVSDRRGRRRPNIVVGSALMALAAALLGLVPDWRAALVAAGILGLGYGVYVAVESALMSELLPSADARGRDLGLLNIANAAPQVLGPAIAAVLVTHAGGYATLYLVTAAVTLAGGLLVLGVRSVA